MGSCFSLPRPIVKAALESPKTQLPVIGTGILATAELPICEGKAGSLPLPSQMGGVGWSINNRNARYLHLYLGNANSVVVNFRIVWLATKRGALRNRATKPSSVKMHRILATCPLRAKPSAQATRERAWIINLNDCSQRPDSPRFR